MPQLPAVRMGSVVSGGLCPHDSKEVLSHLSRQWLIPSMLRPYHGQKLSPHNPNDANGAEVCSSAEGN